MSEVKSRRAATLDRFCDVVNDIQGVDVRLLPPFTVLLVQTTHSLYRLVITDGPEVFVQGGAFFPNPTSAYLNGASLGGRCLKVGWIGIGLGVEIRSEGRDILTSRVRGIITEPPAGSVVH